MPLCIHHTGVGIEDLPADVAFDLVSKKLTYTKAVISEALRLHPSVPKDIKFAAKDDTLPDGTKIQTGQCVMYSPYAMGRDPTIWDEPLQFRPSRWMKHDGGKDTSLYRPTTVSEFKFPTFNAGPRRCSGRPLAYLETQLMLACLITKFKISSDCDLKDESYVATIVMPRKAGLRIKVQPR